LINSLPPSTNIKDTGGGYPKQSQHMAHDGIVSPQIGPLRVGSDNSKVINDGRVSSSCPLASSEIMHGSPPLSDNFAHHSNSEMPNDGFGNGVVNNFGLKPLDNALYSQCVIAIRTLAKDPSPRVGSLGRRVLSIIGVEQVVAKPSNSVGVRTSEATVFHRLARSTSWFDMNSGRFHFQLLTFPVLFGNVYLFASIFYVLNSCCYIIGFILIIACYSGRTHAANLQNSSSHPSSLKLYSWNA
jgi:regulator-associated protein of mTOR